MGAGESCLGDQLYYAVNSQLEDEEKGLAGKITGMLLETDDSTIQQLLDETSLLQKAIQQARVTIHSSDVLVNSVVISKSESNEVSLVQSNNTGNDDNTDELGQLLYDKVSVVYPRAASKLTGMLLEMNRTSLKEILDSELLLKTAIDKAFGVLMELNNGPRDRSGHSNNTDSCNGGIGEDSCNGGIGETLYEKVEELYQDRAPKITGMLLELDPETLNRLLHDDAMLREAASKAAETIKSTANLL